VAAAEAEEVVTVVVEMVASLVVAVVVARRSILMTNTLEAMGLEAKSGCGFTNERHNKKKSSWR